MRILLRAGASTACSSAPRSFRSGCRATEGLLARVISFDPRPDRPREAKELAADRRDYLVAVLASRRQREEPLVQAMLRLPADLHEMRRQLLLALLQCRAFSRPVPVRPRDLEE